MIGNGQVHGGMTQGIARELFEDAVHDDTGTISPAPSSITPYRRRTICPVYLGNTSTPTALDPISAAGTIGSAHTIVNAVVDALSQLEVIHVDMPLRP